MHDVSPLNVVSRVRFSAVPGSAVVVVQAQESRTGPGLSLRGRVVQQHEHPRANTTGVRVDVRNISVGESFCIGDAVRQLVEWSDVRFPDSSMLVSYDSRVCVTSVDCHGLSC